MTTHVGRECSICAHRRRAAIEAEIVDGRPLLQIAERFKVGRCALQRHRDNHFRREVQTARAMREFEALARGGTVLERLEALDDRMASIIDEAMLQADKSTAIRAFREMRGLIELRAKLTGELREGGNIVTNSVVINSVEFRSLQVNIVQALAPYPDAKRAVLKALGAPDIDAQVE